MSDAMDQSGTLADRTWQHVALVAAALSLLAIIGAVVFAARKEAALAKQALALRAVNPEAVARAARVLKLVTAEIVDTVRLEEVDPSTFRPDIKASVELPVRLSYGSDLSKLEASWVRVELPKGIGPRLSGVMRERSVVIVKIPRPKRLAAEPLLSAQRAEVTRSFLRFGEDELLLKLREQASQAAMQLELGPKEQARIEEMTKAQFQLLMRAIVRDEADVQVEFVD
jgi:hypothetical protein